MRSHYIVRALTAAAVTASLAAPAAQARFLNYYPPYTPVHHKPVHHSAGTTYQGHPRLRTTSGVTPLDVEATS
jgi:hypothetical protein